MVTYSVFWSIWTIACSHRISDDCVLESCEHCMTIYHGVTYEECSRYLRIQQLNLTCNYCTHNNCIDKYCMKLSSKIHINNYQNTFILYFTFLFYFIRSCRHCYFWSNFQFINFTLANRLVEPNCIFNIKNDLRVWVYFPSFKLN